MKVAIMQPYFVPYIGYFQLIAAVDLFVLHDRVKYVKKGWINRNRILQDGSDAVISLPISHDSDTLDIRDRRVAPAAGCGMRRGRRGGRRAGLWW